jgi:uncharacterized protein
MDVAITGSSGLIGSALVAALHDAGHTVRRVVRSKPGPGEVLWAPAEGTIDAGALAGVDAVVHLAGEGIEERRWTDEQKRKIHDSRVDGTALLARTLAALDPKPSVLLSGSAVGYYGCRGDEVLDEETSRGEGFLADVVVDWEAAAAPAVEAGIRTVFLRTGIVLSTDGGALDKMLPLFKLGLGGHFGDGTQYWPWISIEDEVGAIMHLLTAEVEGPVNLAAPESATNGELTKTLGRVLGRPTLVPIPSFGPRLLLGRELADSLLQCSQRMVPTKLLASGYDFAHPTLEGAFRDLLDRPA